MGCPPGGFSVAQIPRDLLVALERSALRFRQVLKEPRIFRDSFGKWTGSPFLQLQPKPVVIFAAGFFFIHSTRGLFLDPCAKVQSAEGLVRGLVRVARNCSVGRGGREREREREREGSLPAQALGLSSLSC